MSEPAASEGLAGRRIAVLNWRDREHPESGGAEEYAWRIAAHLAALGARVDFVTARAPGQSPSAASDGVCTWRRGGRWTVYPWALLWLLRNRFRLDAVLDCQNGIPFFAPLAVRRRTQVLLVVHHVHDSQFGVHFPGWLAAVGRFLEGPASKAVYRRARTVAVSPSTVSAMRDRLAWTGPVHVVPNGLDPVPAAGPRATEPRLVCLGRLVAHKRVDRVIEALTALARPGVHLDVVGRGPAEPAVRAAATSAVTVHGWVTAEEKARLLGEAWLHVTLSDGEGWGLSVLEAAAAGLPTLCRDVDGLRDSVRDGETGWLAPFDAGPAEVAAALDAALKQLSDPAEADAMADRCRAWAARFDWTRTGDRIAALLRAPLPDDHGVSRNRSPVDPDSRGQNAMIIAEGRPWVRGMPEAVVHDGRVVEQVDPAAYPGARPAGVVERLLGAPVDR